MTLSFTTVTRLTAVNAVLLAVVALAVVGVEVAQRPAASLETNVRRYATAVTNAHLDAALAEIAPSERGRWADWVRNQLGNVYEVRGIAVRTNSLLGRATRVTVVLDVNREYPGEFYQPTATVEVQQVDGRWYLSAPLLAN